MIALSTEANSTYHWDLILSSSATFCFLASLTAASRDFIVFTVLSITSWLSGLDWQISPNQKTPKVYEILSFLGECQHLISTVRKAMGMWFQVSNVHNVRRNVTRMLLASIWPFVLPSCQNSLIRADKPCSQCNLFICLLYLVVPKAKFTWL